MEEQVLQPYSQQKLGEQNLRATRVTTLLVEPGGCTLVCSTEYSVCCSRIQVGTPYANSLFYSEVDHEAHALHSTPHLCKN